VRNTLVVTERRRRITESEKEPSKPCLTSN